MSAQNRERVVSTIREFSWVGVRFDSDSGHNDVRVAISPAEFLGFSDYLRNCFDARRIDRR